LPGLTDAITAQTSFACQVLNPFDGMQLSSSIKENKMRREAPSYLSACGLAMRRFLQ
jgi:type IV pilus assembly protein PilM